MNWVAAMLMLRSHRRTETGLVRLREGGVARTRHLPRRRAEYDSRGRLLSSLVTELERDTAELLRTADAETLLRVIPACAAQAPVGGDPMSARGWTGWPVAVLLVVLAAALVTNVGGWAETAIPYSQFLALVGEGRVAEVAIGEQTIRGTYGDGDPLEFATTRPPGVDEHDLIRELREIGVEFTGSRPTGVAPFLVSVLGFASPES